MKTVNVSYKAIERLYRRIEKANLKKHGASLSFGSMKTEITCIYHDSDTVEVPANWRETIKQTYLKS